MPGRRTIIDRAERKPLITYVTPDVARDLKIIAAEKATSVQALVEEAIIRWIRDARRAVYAHGQLKTASGEIYTDADLAMLKEQNPPKFIAVVSENRSVLPTAMVELVDQVTTQIVNAKLPHKKDTDHAEIIASPLPIYDPRQDGNFATWIAAHGIKPGDGFGVERPGLLEGVSADQPVAMKRKNQQTSAAGLPPITVKSPSRPS